MSADTYTNAYSDSYSSSADGSTVSTPGYSPFVAGDGVTALYPYLLRSDGMLVPLYAVSVGTDVGVTLSTTLTNTGSVRVTWTLIPGATGYGISRDGGDPVTLTVGSGANAYVFENLVNGQKYTFSVQPLPNGALRTITVTAVNINTPTPATGSGFGQGPFGTTPFGA